MIKLSGQVHLPEVVRSNFNIIKKELENLISTGPGADGREVELQSSGTHIQWRYVGDPSWTNLVALSSLTGDDGREIQIQNNGTHLQWRYVGDVTWTDLIALTAITGPAGPAGVNFRHLNADFLTSSTTAVDTNLGFSASANKVYGVKIWGHCKKDTSSSGLKVGISAPSGSTITGTEFRGQAAYSTAMPQGEITAINTLGGTFATGVGVKVPFRLEFTITIGSTAGNVRLMCATVTSNQLTIYAGTHIEWAESTGV